MTQPMLKESQNPEPTSLIFENHGELDLRCITTFGVSAKESDSPIGYFGTGLKYAISILLRNGCSVNIQTGGEDYTFWSKQVEIRGKVFDLVHMNDNPLGFTTELGKNWEVWQAFRELYSNMLDEGGKADLYEHIPEPCDTRVRIIVQGREIIDAFREKDTIFLASKPVAHAGNLQIHPGRGGKLYYKGVRVADVRYGSFTYNITDWLDLTEDRGVKYSYQIDKLVSEGVAQLDDPALIRQFLTSGPRDFESDINFDFCAAVPSDQFVQVVNEMASTRDGRLNKNVENYCRKYADITLPTHSMEINALQQKKLDKAMGFCKKLGFDIEKYEVIILPSLGTPHELGRAEDNRIYLSGELFNQGTTWLAHGLIEEYVHLETGFGDHTRELQTWLFKKVIELGEIALGESL